MNAYLEKLFGLSGQTAVVIGGTGVLCGAMAEGLAQAGAFVVVAGRDETRGLARVESIKKLGGDGAFVSVDVTSRSSIEALLAATLKLRGQVDILINGAGVNAASAYFEVADDVWDRVLDTNLKSTHFGCQIFGRQMADSGRGGAILNIGSVTSDKPLSRVIAYSASKAAVISLTQNVGRELAPYNVRVNAICPGFFPAEQNRKILTEDRVKNIMAGTPMKRFGEADELVGCMLLLVSRTAGSFITGAAYYVDGGFTASRF
ncbi:MAG TPA: SDR family oxidoreductase [Pirellulales bacterium]|jgi:NAD(P)-dependent dehydrogenase (short-subunit alcohol dehydrogenase family)|nr:SDR family oxidoreductase [Pirellulales bacterium]